MNAPVHRARTRVARLLPYALAIAALPLLAPTCGGQQPGIKAFSKGSLVIPMDACYQNTPNQLTSGALFTPAAGCPSNGSATSDQGNVLRAYGLVYQLLRNNIPVYWVINSAKTGTRDTAHPDIVVSYPTGGSTGPVDKYNGTGARVGAMPPNNAGSSISYLGGPFVVDGSDADAALAAMGTLGTSFQTVNVHRANVAFTAEVARAMSGNFSNSGVNIPPPIALLNITGGDNKNSEVVIQGYLNDAGLGAADFSGAGGIATPTGHGKIYDDLYPADFLPTTCTTSCANGSTCTGGQCASNLVAYGYSILWVPHWCGPGSETRNPSHPFPSGRTYADVLAAIRAYLNAGHDVLAECASLGTFEGVNNSNVCSGSSTGYPAGTPAPNMQVKTTSGVDINGTFPSACNGTPPPNPAACEAAATFLPAASPAHTTFATPFLQIGDFPYYPVTGAIQNYLPTASYVPGTIRLVGDTANATQDYFTWLPPAAPRGNLVYLAGHDYSGGQTSGGIQVGGSRLVLNSLFNLGSSCVATHAACVAQGALGICRNGSRECCTQPDIDAGYCQDVGVPFCKPGSPQAETCDGQDDDCDGIVDNHLTDPQATSPGCYAGDATTPKDGIPLGVCHQGVYSCQPSDPAGPWICVGQVLPGVESCNGLDDDCDGVVDDNLVPPGGSASCFTGPPDAVMHSTFPPSQCQPGTWQCQSATWSCVGQKLPQQEICEGQLLDYNCNGVVGDGCQCVGGTTRSCYTGPAGTAGLGICRAGTQTCVPNDPGNPTGPGTWNNPTCSGQVVPQAEVCGNGLDDDCNGKADDCSECTSGQARPCYPGGAAGCSGSPGGPFTCKGVCAPGQETCVNGKWSGACSGAVLPGPEICDGKDNACSGTLDEGGAPCPLSLACINGVCTQPTWGGESDCLPGYVHSGGGTSGTCVAESCPSAPCAPGQLCQGHSTCLDPCQGVTCGPGAFCSAGVNGAVCIGGGCTATPCSGAGEVCRNGTCQADVCAGVACPAGTFCRGNYALPSPTYDCVRACATVTCPAGQACGADGFCAPDPCATVTCATGQVCRASGTSTSCVTDPCPPGICGTNQACVDGRCVDDPCAGITCPAGVCARGQCYASNNINGYGPQPGASSSGTSGGCGCGGGDAGPTALLLSLLALPLARRRRRDASSRTPRSFRLGWRRGLRGAAALLVASLAAFSAGCSKKSSSSSGGCSDTRFDAANCETCGHACASGEACVDSTCITTSAAVPSIASVAPAPVAAHTSQTFTLTGDRFQSGATLRVSGAGLPLTVVGTTFGSSTQLTAQVDLSAAAPGTLSLQLANPDHTTSNVEAVQVVTPTPIVDGVSPSSALAGTQPQLHVTGSAFTPSAICVLSVSGTDHYFPPVSTPASGSLDCTVDLGQVPPGSYHLFVQNENNTRSPSPGFPFDVTSATPALASLSPNPAQQGAEIRLVITGSGFVPGSTAQIDKGAGFLDLTTLYVAPTLLEAPISLSAYAAGDYPVRVSNPGIPTPSGTLALTVTPTAPLATGLAVTPPSPRVGDVGVVLALSGSGFTDTCLVQALPPGGGWAAVAPAGSTTPSSIQGTTDPGVDGTWYARVSCPAGCPSPPCITSAFPFQVASNVASLATVTPAGGVQGTSLPTTPSLPTVTGSNFLAGMVLRLSGSGSDIPATLVGPAPATSATFSLSLAGATVGAHTLVAVNPGAAASNGIAFSVTPGAPSIARITTSCSGSCTATCAVQQANPVTVTISGSNFGSGVSRVFADNAILGLFEVAPPLGTVTVVDASTISVALDTTDVPGPLPVTFTVTVENPGQPASNGVDYKVATICP